MIEAAIRRHRRNEMPEIEEATSVGEITIRPDLYQAYAGEASLELTAREFEILHLLSQSDRVLRREEIYERVWGYAMAHGDRSVDVFVRKLRQKLRSASPEWSYIHTHFGVGYRFAPEHDGGSASAAAPRRWPRRSVRRRAPSPGQAEPAARSGARALARRRSPPSRPFRACRGAVHSFFTGGSRVGNVRGARSDSSIPPRMSATARPRNEVLEVGPLEILPDEHLARADGRP